jgi:probable HAF family extracellular repeat protein
MKRLILIMLMIALAALATTMAARAQDVGPGYALSFNGTNQYVAGPSQASLNSFPLTAMVWFQDAGNGGGMVNKYVSSSYNGWQIWIDGTDVQAWYIRDRTDLVYTNASGAGLEAVGGYNDGQWHHAALVVNSNGGSLYVDGVLKSTVGWIGSAGPVTTTQPLEIGAYPGTAGFFEGELDEASIWNVALTQSQIQSYMHESLSGNESGLLAYYRFDDGSGTTATNAAVSTGSAYNGTLAAGPVWVQSTAPIGVPAVSSPLGALSITTNTAVLTAVVGPFYQTNGAFFSYGTNTSFGSNTPTNNVHEALAFDGSTSYVLLPNESYFDFPGAFSIECWINVTAFTSNWQAIVTKGDSSWRVHRGFSSNSLAFSTTGLNPNGTTDPDLYGTRNVNDGLWHHVAAVYDGTNKYLYVDGTLDASVAVTGTLATNTYAVEIGENAEQTARIWDGKIDEVRLWNAALSQTTISNWMWQGVTSSHPDYANLAGYWSMNDGTGTSVVDLSGHGNTGAFEGNLAWTSGQSLSNEVVGFQVSSLNDGTQYYYSVTATNTAGITVGPTVPFKTGGLQGYVLSGGIGVSNVAIRGSAGFQVVTDTNGYFWGPGPAQTLTPSLEDTGFSPGSQLVTPGVTVTFIVSYGCITGTVTGVAGGTSYVNLAPKDVNGDSWPGATSDVIGNYSICGLDLNEEFGIEGEVFYIPFAPYTLTPSKYGYHFTPASATGCYPAIPENFVVASTPPSFTNTLSASIVNANEDQNPEINIVLQQGDVPLANVTLSVVSSSNPSLIPLGNIFVIPGTQADGYMSTVQFYAVPGVTGSSTITLAANDGINPATEVSFTLQINRVAQTPVAGMPVALGFDGSNNVVVAPGFGNTAPTTEVTVEFWEYVQSLRTQPVFHLTREPNNPNSLFSITGPVQTNGATYGGLTWEFGGDGISYLFPQSVVGQWMHFAFVSSQSANGGAGSRQIYVNGILANELAGAGTFANYNADLLLGSATNETTGLLTTNGLPGALSELRVWNVALSASNILSTMNNPLIGTESGLVLYYRFNEDSGLTIHDSSPSGLNATVQGGYPYPAWVQAQTNFMNFAVPSYSTSNMLYLPGYLQDQPQSALSWTITDTSQLHGSLTQTAGGEWDYVPASMYSGNASFTFAVSSGPDTLTNTAVVNIVVAPQNPPGISPIPNQLTEENIPTAPILFTLTDTNTDVTALIRTPVSDNANLVDSQTGFTFTLLTNNGGTNATYAMVITPLTNAIGSANITLTITAPYSETNISFVLQVTQPPAYTIIDLGVLPGRTASYARSINNLGQVVGYCDSGPPTYGNSEAFLYTGYASSQEIESLQDSSNTTSAAYAINKNGQITGTFQVSAGVSHAFVYDSVADPVMVDFGALGTNSGNSFSTGLGINDNEVVVGFSSTTVANQIHGFESGASLTDLGLPGGTTVATAINDARQFVGYIVTNGVTNAFVATPVAANGVAAGTNYPGFLPGGINSFANGINQSGDVVGASVLANGFPHGWLQTSTGGMVDLGLPANMLGATATAVNTFDQVVGTAVTTNGVTHAFLYSTGQINDLNNLIPYEQTNTWQLTAAYGINDNGAIVGTGITGGQVHAFLALPAWVIGQPIAPPLGTVAQEPVVTVISGPVNAPNPFFWSSYDNQLYAIVPCTAEIQWPTSFENPADPTNTTAPVITVSQSVWPRPAQTHVAATPVQLVPQGLPADVSFNYIFQSLMYSTSSSAAVDANNNFTCPTNAYSVLQYLLNTGGQVTSATAPSTFQVVRSVLWNDPNYLINPANSTGTGVPAVIGTPITNATHFDYAGRNGYVFFQKSVYDGLPSDPNRAYNQASRTGPIIPVNTVNSGLPVPDQPLVVVWYHTNALGVAWSDSPYQYDPYWPSINPNNDPSNTIVIANQQNPVLLPLNYMTPYPYVQNDPTQPGFNPNEEHAQMISGSLFALRNDLNAHYNYSQPYVLLKYQDANNNNQWTMRVFYVVATNAAYPTFTFAGTAGDQIQPPAPLSSMQLCTSSNTVSAGPYYRAQVNGLIYAIAGGPNGGTTNLSLRFWYPLQPGFFYENTNAAVGSCIPWLDNLTGTPVNVTYVISWPTNGNPVYSAIGVGQTVTTSTVDISDLLNASIVYDTSNPLGGATTTNLARLYDPYTARSVAVPLNNSWTSNGLSFNNANGLYQFANLPYYLQVRLIYDPNNNLLEFQGVNGATGYTTSPGPPILLNNVMSLRELTDITNTLDPTGKSYPDFDQLVTNLYYLTQNPNMLTLNPPGVSSNNYDHTFLVGLMAVTNASNGVVSIVPENLGGNPKALTTALTGVPPPQPIATNNTIPPTITYAPEYVTVVQDDPAVPGSVVQVFVIQITNGLASGSLAVLPGNNPFDQRLTLRHANDFGGNPDALQFQWYFFTGDNNGLDPLSTSPPVLDDFGNVLYGNGWQNFPVAADSPDITNQGANTVTLGEGGQSGLLVIGDSYWISRYQGYNIDGTTNWSGWLGQEGGGSLFAEGWINRVLAALSPFDDDVSNFHTDPIDTYQSMLELAGAPYQGPIALNGSDANSVGLIQAYQTVLGVGESLSIEGSPPVNNSAANTALQGAAGDISQLDVVLGNEAYAEFSDPSVGFSTSSSFGSVASSLFAFEDEVDTLLDQELDLLRGRDDTATTVTAYPVYNRLYWNFTGGNGQDAYVSTFNITDVNNDGQINSADAQIMFPQGHGDAWGYYLSALTVYCNLLQNPFFAWDNLSSSTSVDGVAVTVNYADAQNFAQAATQKAQTGANIVQLTYESYYTANPSGEYEGYYDTDTNRAWGVSEWARRAGQGAYFDWVSANSLVPAVDPNTNDTGLNLVDRATVTAISAIPPTATILQNDLNEADAGLNPLGLSAQSVPFDINPTLIDEGQTHFEQIYGRAVTAMANAVATWNQVNEFTVDLRQEQDTVQQFTQNVTAQDQAYQSQLISIFGYPYAGDIGQAGSTYPQGYTGPDLYHYMYVDMSSLDSAVAPPNSTITGYYTNMSGVNSMFFSADVPTGYPLISNLAITFPAGTSANLFQPPASWGSRQAPGTIQMAAETMMEDEIRFQEALANYNALLTQIQNNLTLLEGLYNLNVENSNVVNAASGEENTLSTTILGMTTAAADLTQTANTTALVAAAIVAAVPLEEGLADDCFSGLRGALLGTANAQIIGENTAAEVLTTVAAGLNSQLQGVEAQTATTIAANNLSYQQQQQVTALQNQIQEEPALRLECLNQRETVIQDLGAYQAAVSQGEQVLQQRCTLAQQANAQTEAYRYQDMTFRIFQNDAIQTYQAQFALAQRYVYMAAIAYDFETDLLNTDSGAGQQFLTDIIQEQGLGEMDNGTNPVVGVPGLADPLAQMGQDFAVLKGQLGFNNPQTETGKFSLRYSLFRQQESETNAIPINGTFTNDWQTELQNHIVPDLWQIPEFVRYCRPFAPQSAGPQPGLVIKFGTTITYGLNFFGWPLAGGDSSYDPTLFTTKVRSVGVWFDSYDNSGLSTTPRIYLIPVGSDMMRSPTDGLTVRAFRVQDQAIPIPYTLGAETLSAPNYIPMNDSLSGTLGQIRQFSSFLGYTDQSAEIDPTEVTDDSRQIGRSVWNSEWILIIPGGTLLNDPNAGLQTFVNSVSDIKIFFQTYSYSGD